jgi:Copper transport outer membrane protein, MctB
LISFRYHVVSIVAVFLALGLGVLVGTTVLDQGLVANLKERTHNLEQQLEQQAAADRSDLSEARTTASRLDRFIGAAEPFLLQDRLAGRRVVVVTYDGIDPTARDEAVSSLRTAGAEIAAVLEVTGKMASTDPGTQDELASVLGASGSTPIPTPTETEPPSGTPSGSSSPGAGTELTRVAAGDLADRLARGIRSTGEPPRPTGPDLLNGLIGKGFVKSGVSASDLASVGGPDQVILVVSGGDQAPPVAVASFMIPLVEGLAEHPATWIAVGEDARPTADPLVAQVRADRAVSGATLVTVDDLDPEDFGGITLVLGLQTLIEEGRGGDYGIADGADGILPAAG